MAITSGVKPHNGWVVVNGSRFQVIHGSVEFTTLNSTNQLHATLPLTAPGYLEFFAPLNGADSVKIQAIVLGQTGEQTLTPNSFTIKTIEFMLTHTQIHIHATDEMSQLSENRDNDTYTNQKNSDVVQKIAEKNNIQVKILKASKVMAGRKVEDQHVHTTDNVSAYTAIHKRAEIDGVRAYMNDQGVLNYGPPGTGGSYSVFWQRPMQQSPMVSDCLDLRVTHNLDASGTQENTVLGYNHDDKQKVEEKSTVPGVGATKKNYQDSGKITPEQAQQQSLAAADRQANHEWELSATVVGDPSIKSDGNIVLSGAPEPLSQTFPIDTVTHNFGINGYTTTMNGKNKGKGRGNGGGG
jgi:phage protein D